MSNTTQTSTIQTESNSRTVETTPTIKPTGVWLLITVAVGGLLIALVISNVNSFGGPQVANVIANAIALLTVIATLRLLIRIWVLKQTTYQVTQDGIHRSYELLFRKQSKRIPMEMVRSHEFRQSRVQRLFGYGTIAVNEGLGPLELEDVPDPQSVSESIERYRQ